MAGSDISLSSSMRTNLLQLQGVQDSIAKKQNILSTGNKINTALDGPTSFFAAKGLTQRAGDLSALKDTMGQAISTIKAADKGLSSIDDMIEQARGLTTAAYSALGTDAGSVATR
ncbi:flagellin, partial [Azospirillum sp. Sp 7]